MDSLIVFAAQYLVFAIPLIAMWLWWRQPTDKRKIRLALTGSIAGLLALVLFWLAGQLYDNPRPFVERGIEPLISHDGGNGFPSQHTTFAMTLTAVIYFFSRRWAAAALAITLTVGTARVLADVHHGIDIAGGLVVGALAGVLAYWLLDRFYRRGPDPKQPADNH